MLREPTSDSHISPLRYLMSKAKGKVYRSIDSLEGACKTKDAYVIMEGDDGGQIYLTYPAALVKCDESKLQNLLKQIDDRGWKDSSMAHLVYEIVAPGTKIPGGMGGGMAEDGLWIHKDLNNLKEKIKAVLDDNEDSI